MDFKLLLFLSTLFCQKQFFTDHLYQRRWQYGGFIIQCFKLSNYFMANYSPSDRISAGGGNAHEGEDIEVLEMPLAEALALVRNGGIVDAKTVMLIQHAVIEGLV